MATGYIDLPIPGGTAPDGTTDNLAAQYSSRKGTQSGADAHSTTLDFDAATIENWYWQYIWPADFSSSLVLNGKVQCNATTGNIIFGCQQGSTASGDADTWQEHAFATAQTATVGANATEARRDIDFTISITNTDSPAAGERVIFRFYRDGSNGSDTLSVDAELGALYLSYTTT